MKRFTAAAVLAGLLASWAVGQTIVRVRDGAGNVVAELKVPPGAMTVEVVPAGSPAPGPGPLPPPIPVPPNPVPPNPIPTPPPNVVKVAWAVVIRDDTPGAMTAGQLALLRDPNWRTQLKARGVNWEVLAADAAAVTQPAPAGRGYGVRANGQPSYVDRSGGAPCVLLLSAQGQFLKGFKLPEDANGFMAAVNGG